MGKDDVTWLNICYFLFAGVVAYVSYQGIEAIGAQFGILEKYGSWFPTVCNVGSLAIGGAVAYWLQMDKGRREYHLSSVVEVQKVVWPSLEDTKKMTIIIAIVVAIFAVILSVFDLLWGKVLQFILP